MALFMTVFFSSVVVDLQAQANSFDLNHLEQMESASVILDRNGKIFGQIYVENRETVPYEKLAPDLINAVIAVEDAKFYEHHGYDLLGIIRAALKNLTAGHATARCDGDCGDRHTDTRRAQGDDQRARRRCRCDR